PPSRATEGSYGHLKPAVAYPRRPEGLPWAHGVHQGVAQLQTDAGSDGPGRLPDLQRGGPARFPHAAEPLGAGRSGHAALARALPDPVAAGPAGDPGPAAGPDQIRLDELQGRLRPDRL